MAISLEGYFSLVYGLASLDILNKIKLFFAPPLKTNTRIIVISEGSKRINEEFENSFLTLSQIQPKMFLRCFLKMNIIRYLDI